jgi:hypothetical protein
MSAPTIIYRTTDPLRWGDGKGANLVPGEVDQNFFNLAEAIAAVSAIDPHEITSITVSGNQMAIHLDGGATFGPFTLPVAALRFTGAWLPLTLYQFADFFTQDDPTANLRGLYLVLQDHTSDTAFFANAANGVGPFYQLIASFPLQIEIPFFVAGKPGTGLDTGGTMVAHLAVRDFYLPAGLTGSLMAFETEPFDDASYPILRNADVIGSADYGGGGTISFTFIADVQFIPGDMLKVVRPDVIDDEAAGLALTFSAVLGTIPEAPSA